MGGQYYNPLQRLEEKLLLALSWIYVPSYCFWLWSFVKAPSLGLLTITNCPLGVCRFLVIPSPLPWWENIFWRIISDMCSRTTNLTAWWLFRLSYKKKKSLPWKERLPRWSFQCLLPILRWWHLGSSPLLSSPLPEVWELMKSTEVAWRWYGAVGKRATLELGISCFASWPHPFWFYDLGKSLDPLETWFLHLWKQDNAVQVTVRIKINYIYEILSPH